MLIKTGPQSATENGLRRASERAQVAGEPQTQSGESELEASAVAVEAAEDGFDGPLSGDSGQRIAHFLRGVTQESLEQARYLSTASAFRNVGSAAGSLAFTPLAIKVAEQSAPLIGGLAIGGTVVAGAIGAAAGVAWLHSRDNKENETNLRNSGGFFKKAGDVSMDVAAGLKALPKFIYPSVHGASPEQLQEIYSALDRLPLQHATASATMEVIPNLTDTGISGMAQPGSSHVRILLDEGRMNRTQPGLGGGPSSAQRLVLHEQAHAVDYSGGFGLLGSYNWRTGFGREPFVSNYASTNRYEDFAESYEAYYANPTDFQARFPEKAAAIESISQQDPLYRAADQPKIREAGRKVGEALGRVPHLRTALEVGTSLIAPIQMYRGADGLSEGLRSGDIEQQVAGKMNLASGMFLSLPGGSPLALVSSLSGAALKSVAAGDESGKEWANRWADRTLAASTGPFGMVTAAAVKELKANGLKFDDATGFTPAGWRASQPTKKSLMTGTAVTLGGLVGGALLGAAAGGALGGSAGAVTGAFWGQVAGGVVGLAGYGTIRTLAENKKNDHPLALTQKEVAFLGKTVGGAVLAGAAGSGLGYVAGQTAGQVVGQMVGGATGAAVLGTMGGWAGMMGGAYGGARVGAAVGSGRLWAKEGGAAAELETAKTLTPEGSGAVEETAPLDEAHSEQPTDAK